jgi:hypothetical protein
LELSTTHKDKVGPTELEIRRVRQSAETAFATVLGFGADNAISQPQPVFTPDGQASYWLVASLRGERVQALARILPDGCVATVGPSKETESDAAQAATGLSASMASHLTTELTERYTGAHVSQAHLVHDGPIGREAWLYAVKQKSGEELWVFATGGGLYSRPAREPLAK